MYNDNKLISEKNNNLSVFSHSQEIKNSVSHTTINRGYCGTVHTTTDKASEEGKMSIVIMGSKNNELFCVTDSRNTNSLTHTFDDNWKKTTKIEDRNMIIALAGENSINGKNILDIITEIHYNKRGLSNDEFLNYIAHYLVVNKNGSGIISLFAGFYLNEVATVYTIDILSNNINVRTWGNNEIAFAGVEYSNEFLKRVNILAYNDAEEAVKFYSEYIEKIIELNKFLPESCVGGSCQSVTATLSIFKEMNDRTYARKRT